MLYVDFSGIIDFYKFFHLQHLATNTDSNDVVMLTNEKSTFSQKKIAITTKKPGKFYIISGKENQVAMKSRVGAQLEAEEIAMHEVRTRWQRVIPASSPKKYQLLRTIFPPETKKFQHYLEEGKPSSLLVNGFCESLNGEIGHSENNII